MDERVALSLPVLIIGIIGVLFAGWLARNVFSRDRGTVALHVGVKGRE